MRNRKPLPPLHIITPADRARMLDWLHRILQRDYIPRRRPVDMGNPADVALAVVEICAGQCKFFYHTRWHGDASHWVTCYAHFLDFRTLLKELDAVLDSYRPVIPYFRRLQEIF